jgi:hypothetical protein
MAVAPLTAVSPSNALGSFEIMPRRLADFGLVKKLKRTKSKAGKTIYVAEFVSPLTCTMFLKSPQAQYKVFAKSMQEYADKIVSGDIKKDPKMSLSGALAVLHKAGPAGLNGELFPSTKTLYDKVDGIF